MKNILTKKQIYTDKSANNLKTDMELFDTLLRFYGNMTVKVNKEQHRKCNNHKRLRLEIV